MQNFPFSKTLFWDIDENNIDLTAKKGFIIPRVLVRGGMKDVKQLMTMYNKEEIIEAIKSSRALDKRTHNFCINYFQIPKEEMLPPSEFYQ